MMTLCLRYVRGNEDAVEVLNDAFLKIFMQLGRYDPVKASLYTWMRKIVINTALPFTLRDLVAIAIPPGACAVRAAFLTEVDRAVLHRPPEHAHA